MIQYIQKICLQGEMKMFAYIKGNLDTKTNAFVVIDDVKEVLGEGFKSSSNYEELSDAVIL